MSNNTVFEPDVMQPAAETEAQPVQTAATNEPKKKNGAARFFSLLFAVVAIACFLLPCSVDGESVAFYQLLLDSVTGSNAILGVIPTTFAVDGAIGQFCGLTVYVTALCLAIAAIGGIIGLFSKKAARRVRTTLFFLTFSATTLSVALTLNAYTADAELLALVTENVIVWAVAVVGLVASFIAAICKVGKKAWGNLFQTLFALATVTAFAFFLTTEADAFGKVVESLGELATTITLVLYVVAMLFAAFALVRLFATKKNGWDLVRYIVGLLLAAVAAYVAFTVAEASDNAVIVAIVAIVATVLNILGWLIGSKGKKERKVKVKKVKPVKEKKVKAPKAKKAAKAEKVNEVVCAPVAVAPVVPVVAPVAEQEYIREEYAEALPYEGGPVEGVELAEEVNPTYVAPVTEVKTAGYDFYNCKSFDPFIAMLTNEERNQFTELFILKFKGPMPELPDYVVGGDNKIFFRKLFIYLGQYRDRIPDELLTKLYQFAIKM